MYQNPYATKLLREEGPTKFEVLPWMREMDMPEQFVPIKDRLNDIIG